MPDYIGIFQYNIIIFKLMSKNDQILEALKELNKKVVPLEVTEYLRHCGKSFNETKKGLGAQVSDTLWHLWQKKVILKDGDYYYHKDFKEDTGQDDFSNESTSYFHERDLHPLLVAYLERRGIFSKTIYHERSSQGDKGQTWIHPDIVGVKFATFKKNSTKDFLRSNNVEESYDIYSYELKIKIDTDNNLKKYFFQALSNSNWANYGYLVALEINPDRLEELERLSNMFGIGVIQLSPNISKTKILFPSTKRKINFKSIDKLSDINSDFEQFIIDIEGLITEKNIDKYHKLQKDFISNSCDNVMTDEQLKNYCEEKKIAPNSYPHSY